MKQRNNEMGDACNTNTLMKIYTDGTWERESGEQQFLELYNEYNRCWIWNKARDKGKLCECLV